MTTRSPFFTLGRAMPPCGTPSTTRIVTIVGLGFAGVVSVGAVSVSVIVSVSVSVGAVVVTAGSVVSATSPSSPPHPARPTALAATASTIAIRFISLSSVGRGHTAAA